MDKAKRKKMSLELIPVLIVRFRGVEQGEMMVRDDDGIITAFCKYCIDNDIWSVRVGGESGGGMLIGAYLPKDKDKIAKFFREQGVDIDEYEENWDYD